MSEPDYSFQQEVARLIEANLLDAALQLINEEVPKRPNDALVYAAKAVVLGRLGRLEEAISASDEALRLDPSDHATHSNKGVTLYELGRYDDAIKSFDACLSLRQHYPVAVQDKIYSLAALGRYSDAVKTYEENDLPDYEEARWLNAIGYIYLHSGDDIRSEKFLCAARKINPFLSAIHYNITEVHRRRKNKTRALLHSAIFHVVRAVESTGILEWLWRKRPAPHITEAKKFTRSGTVFSSEPQQRETRSIMKLLRGMNVAALCNDTWSWFAVNIPYSAAGHRGIYGDIDIILKRPRHFGPYDAGFTYRGFQVKTILVNKDGHISSAKRGNKKLREIKKQLDVLKDFGCEQIFLLELYVLERAYSHRNRFPSPEILMEIQEKALYLEKLGYGYVVMAEEPNVDVNEDAGGVLHMPLNILPAISNPIGLRFQQFADAIDVFREAETTKEMLSQLSPNEAFGVKIGYCLQCQQLTMLIPVGRVSHVCGRCKCPAY